MLDLLGNHKARYCGCLARFAHYGEDVKTLADARASPKQITNFLNKRIGEESEFGKKEAGKTKMHKLLFERWGETLAMDFTHGTNHLGYHLVSQRNDLIVVMKRIIYSHHLPCRHLMHFPCKEHQFELLPAMAISERWSLSSALNVKDELAAAADSQQSIVQMSKLKSPKVRLPYGSPNGSPNGHQTNDEGRVVPASKPTKQVKMNSKTLETPRIMVVCRRRTFHKPSLLNHFKKDRNMIHLRLRNKRQRETNPREPPKASEHTPGKSARQVDIINVPNLLRREKARTQLKQLKLTRGADQLAVPNYPSHLTMSLKQLLEWATKASNLKEVLEMLEKYPVQLKDLYLWARMPECHWEVVRTSHYMHTFVILADLAGPLKTKTCGSFTGNCSDAATSTGQRDYIKIHIQPAAYSICGAVKCGVVRVDNIVRHYVEAG
ncbi:hypothetical protein GQ600_27272 [Phytophthora cactorum]|nr:hypothetical protein GQ600_27272 [Phytophthora cactorum]